LKRVLKFLKEHIARVSGLKECAKPTPGFFPLVVLKAPRMFILTIYDSHSFPEILKGKPDKAFGFVFESHYYCHDLGSLKGQGSRIIHFPERRPRIVDVVYG
jgi:hypothetical protein